MASRRHQLTILYLTIDCCSARYGGGRTFGITELAGLYKNLTAGRTAALMLLAWETVLPVGW